MVLLASCFSILSAKANRWGSLHNDSPGARVDGWGLMTVDLWIVSNVDGLPPPAQELVLMVMHRLVSSYSGSWHSLLDHWRCSCCLITSLHCTLEEADTGWRNRWDEFKWSVVKFSVQWLALCWYCILFIIGCTAVHCCGGEPRVLGRPITTWRFNHGCRAGWGSAAARPLGILCTFSQIALQHFSKSSLLLATLLYSPRYMFSQTLLEYVHFQKFLCGILRRVKLHYCLQHFYILCVTYFHKS